MTESKSDKNGYIVENDKSNYTFLLAMELIIWKEEMVMMLMSFKEGDGCITINYHADDDKVVWC